MKYVNTEKMSETMRARGVDLLERRVLLTRFDNSEQKKDLQRPPNCNGFGRIRHFRRHNNGQWPQNPLPIDPALNWLGMEQQDNLEVQLFQNAVCSWRCWYCFVDFTLLNGHPDHSEYKSAAEQIDLYLEQPERPPVIDISGGQPDLVPEWSLWLLDEIEARGLSRSVYVWQDDNLSNDYLWKHLARNDIDRLVKFQNYGRVGCFKGFDAHSFTFNTRASERDFDQQFGLMRKLVDHGFDVYGYTTFTTDCQERIHDKISEFVDRLQAEVHPSFPLRTIPLRIEKWTPTGRRTGPEQENSLKIQFEAVQAWSEELDRRFSAAERQQPIFLNNLS